MPDGAGRLPLHVAVESNADTEAVALIMNKNPNAVAVADGAGRLPLQMALQAKNVEVATLILEKIPSAAAVADGNGRLRVAAESGCSAETMLLLLDSAGAPVWGSKPLTFDPDRPVRATASGKTPLPSRRHERGLAR